MNSKQPLQLAIFFWFLGSWTIEGMYYNIEIKFLPFLIAHMIMHIYLV